MIYVFAPSQQQADEWFRGEGLRPREVRTFGNRSSCLAGTRFRSADRVVVLGEVDHKVEAVLGLQLRKCVPPPPVERYGLRVQVASR